MIIFPAIDVMNGKCVRLTQGDFTSQKIYSENPAEVALNFEQAGLKHLHLVDLDGAKKGSVQNWDVIKSITSRTKLKIDFGGGIKTESEIEKLFTMGIHQVNLGSIAYREPVQVKSWIKIFGADKIILSADAQREKLAVAGWQSETQLSVFDFIQDYVDAGIEYVTCTDISKDGMLQGPSLELYRSIIKKNPHIKLIASGGVHSWSDLNDLNSIGCYGAIIGKAIYEGKLLLNQLPAEYK